jgi:drug/metabolite transporter (DMT)-like permease
VAIAFGPLLLALVASVASAGFDLTRKLLGRHLSPLPMLVLLAAGSVSLFAVALAVQGGVSPPAAAYFPPALGSVTLNLAANLAFLQSVRMAPLSATIPLLSLTPACTALLAVPLLGERPSARVGLGVVLVVAGAFWLGSRPAEKAGEAGAPPAAMRHLAGAARSRTVQGIWLMAAAAFLWSVTTALDKLAVRHADPAFHGLFLTAGIGLGAAAVLVAQRRLHELAAVRQARGLFLLTLLSGTLALAFQLLAIRVVLVGVMETLKRATGTLSALAVGRLLFAEPLGWQRLAAASTMAAGVALIVL